MIGVEIPPINVLDAVGNVTLVSRFISPDVSIKGRTFQSLEVVVTPAGSHCLLGRSFLDRLGRYTVFIENGMSYLEY
jgi:predicted aspartyl protease